MNDSFSSNSACKSNPGLGVKLQLVSRVNGLLKNLESSLETQNEILKKFQEKKEKSPPIKAMSKVENQRLDIPHKVITNEGKVLNISTRSIEPSPIVDYKTGEQISQILNNHEYSKRDLSMSVSSSKILAASPNKRIEGREIQKNVSGGKNYRSGSMSPATPEALNERVNQQVYHHKSARSMTPPKRKIQFQVGDDNKLSIEDLEFDQNNSKFRNANGFQIQKEKLFGQMGAKENQLDSFEGTRKGKPILKGVDRKLNLEDSLKSFERTTQTQKTKGKLVDHEKSTVEKSNRKTKSKIDEEIKEKVDQQFSALDKIKKNLCEEAVLKKRMLEHRRNMQDQLSSLINECFSADIDFKPNNSKGQSYLNEKAQPPSTKNSNSKIKKDKIYIDSAENSSPTKKSDGKLAEYCKLEKSLVMNIPARSTSPVSKIDKLGKLCKTTRLINTEEKELRTRDFEHPEVKSLVFGFTQKQLQKNNLIKRNKESIFEHFKQLDELFDNQREDLRLSVASPKRKEKELRKEIINLSDRKSKPNNLFDANFVFSQKRSKLCTPTFDEDTENKVLLSKLHRQRVSTKKSGKLYFLNDVDEKLSDMSSKRILSSKSSSSVLFNFESNDSNPKEPLRLNTYSKEQKRLNADLIFNERSCRKELLQKEKEKNVEFIEHKIKSKFFASHLKKNSNVNV